MGRMWPYQIIVNCLLASVLARSQQVVLQPAGCGWQLLALFEDNKFSKSSFEIRIFTYITS